MMHISNNERLTKMSNNCENKTSPAVTTLTTTIVGDEAIDAFKAISADAGIDPTKVFDGIYEIVSECKESQLEYDENYIVWNEIEDEDHDDYISDDTLDDLKYAYEVAETAMIEALRERATKILRTS